MTEETKEEILSCDFCGRDSLEYKIQEIHPYRPKGWSVTIPYRRWICEKCLGEQKGNVSLKTGDEPVEVTAEVAEEEEAESPNPMAGATMQSRIETVIGTKSGATEEAEA